jgi:hypothetical protein
VTDLRRFAAPPFTWAAASGCGWADAPTEPPPHHPIPVEAYATGLKIYVFEPPSYGVSYVAVTRTPVAALRAVKRHLRTESPGDYRQWRRATLENLPIDGHSGRYRLEVYPLGTVLERSYD